MSLYILNCNIIVRKETHDVAIRVNAICTTVCPNIAYYYKHKNTRHHFMHDRLLYNYL